MSADLTAASVDAKALLAAGVVAGDLDVGAGLMAAGLSPSQVATVLNRVPAAEVRFVHGVLSAGMRPSQVIDLVLASARMDEAARLLRSSLATSDEVLAFAAAELDLYEVRMLRELGTTIEQIGQLGNAMGGTLLFATEWVAVGWSADDVAALAADDVTLWPRQAQPLLAATTGLDRTTRLLAVRLSALEQRLEPAEAATIAEAATGQPWYPVFMTLVSEGMSAREALTSAPLLDRTPGAAVKKSSGRKAAAKRPSAKGSAAKGSVAKASAKRPATSKSSVPKAQQKPVTVTRPAASPRRGQGR